VLARWHGWYLRIDPRPARTAWVPLDASVLRDFIGGVGLGTWSVAHETPAGTDPFGAGAANETAPDLYPRSGAYCVPIRTLVVSV
jgi:hypothetical protein